VSNVRVVLFTRYPEPGQAKTRLIPALGAEGAADLHRRLTERTLQQVRAAGLPYEIRSTGRDPAAFTTWLGTTAVVDQGDGDLGARLQRAGAPYPTIFIGADAPDLSPGHLRDAAAALENHNAVLGPAEDGGYWLLGLSRPFDQLFERMPWGTDEVLHQTFTRLRQAHANLKVLALLADLDRPVDLERWPDFLLGLRTARST
jgi:rSAM/selenodomain-associated transferase 1